MKVPQLEDPGVGEALRVRVRPVRGLGEHLDDDRPDRLVLVDAVYVPVAAELRRLRRDLAARDGERDPEPVSVLHLAEDLGVAQHLDGGVPLLGETDVYGVGHALTPSSSRTGSGATRSARSDTRG